MFVINSFIKICKFLMFLNIFVVGMVFLLEMGLKFFFIIKMVIKVDINNMVFINKKIFLILNYFVKSFFKSGLINIFLVIFVVKVFKVYFDFF